MPIITDIENDSPVVTPNEQKKLIEYNPSEESSDSVMIDIRNEQFDIYSDIEFVSGSVKTLGSSGTSGTSGESGTSGTSGTVRIRKEDPKKKNTRSATGAPHEVDKSDALTQSKKNETKSNQNPNSIGITVASHIENGDDKINDTLYWAYRSVPGTKPFGIEENHKKLDVKSIKGFVKYYFNADWNELTKEISIDSVWDVLIAMNIPQVGVFNPVVPYVAEENTEQHMMMLNSKDVFSKGTDTTIGLRDKNPSWADEPSWCGIFTKFAVERTNHRLGADPISVDVYNVARTKSGLVNKPPTGIIDYTRLTSTEPKKHKIHESWLLNGGYDSPFDEKGVSAVFVKGVHYGDKDLTERGKRLMNKIVTLNWEMATISRGTETHIEIAAAINPKNYDVLIIGGNTSLNGTSKNGSQIAVRNRTIPSFSGKGGNYVVISKIDGKWNRNGNTLTSNFNITPTMKKYFDSVGKQKDIDGTLKKLLKEYV